MTTAVRADDNASTEAGARRDGGASLTTTSGNVAVRIEPELLSAETGAPLHRIVIVGGGAGGLELATRLGDTLGRRSRRMSR